MSAFPVVPSLIRHPDVPCELRVLVVGEDVWEGGLEVTSLVINHYLLVGQGKRRPLFEITARPIVCRAIKRKRLRVHAF